MFDVPDINTEEDTTGELPFLASFGLSSNINDSLTDLLVVFRFIG